MKILYYVILLLTVCFSSCSSDADGEKVNVNAGLAPASIVGKELVLKNSSGGTKISATHLSNSKVTVSGDTDYGKYPPSYTYSVTKENTALYHLNVTKKTYIPYYETYTYGKFIFDVSLTFTSESGGTYSGTQINGNGDESNINGKFIIN